jgi:hypothetical protein
MLTGLSELTQQISDLSKSALEAAVEILQLASRKHSDSLNGTHITRTAFYTKSIHADTAAIALCSGAGT